MESHLCLCPVLDSLRERRLGVELDFLDSPS